MNLLLAFLLTSFIVGGTVGRLSVMRRPIVLLGASIVVGAMFYSQRML